MRKMICSLLVVGAALATSASMPAGESVVYKEGGVELEGYLAKPKAPASENAPGILIVHDWMGLQDFAKAQADRLAELGYVAFAADIYGKGVRPANPDEAGEQAGKFKNDRELLRQRTAAGLVELRKVCDPSRIVAIGYCFGGVAVLELGRSGADLRGVVSFHGGLDAPLAAEVARPIPKILVLHGADDPHVPDKQVAEFVAEMRAAKADWQMIWIGNAVHAFTNPAAGTDPTKGAAYNAAADARAWAHFQTFLTETLK
jgi:dienelactone hydrolase